MRKQEFIDRLRTALNGQVSPSLVMENLNYYEDYINTEIRKGRAEEEVLSALGDPRLIARTIIDTNGGDGADNQAPYGEYRQSGADSYGGARYGENGGGSYGGARYGGNGGGSYGGARYGGNGGGSYGGAQYNGNGGYGPGPDGERHFMRVPGWVWLVAVILIIVLVLSAVFSILSFLLPILLPILLIAFLVKLFRDWLN